MRNFRLSDESGHQEAIIEWCAWNMQQYPELELLYHVPNGGKRDKATAAVLKRQGVKAGVPDLVLPVARCGYHGLYRVEGAGRFRPKVTEGIHKAPGKTGVFSCYLLRMARNRRTVKELPGRSLKPGRGSRRRKRSRPGSGQPIASAGIRKGAKGWQTRLFTVVTAAGRNGNTK